MKPLAVKVIFCGLPSALIMLIWIPGLIRFKSETGFSIILVGLVKADDSRSGFGFQTR